MLDVVVIGGGINGLVTAALLAQQKLSTLVLERRESAGGAAVTSELVPGFRVPRLSHAIGPLGRDVVRALNLHRSREIDVITPDPSLTSLGAKGEVLSFHPDQVLTAASINQVSGRDAGRWRTFAAAAQRTARLTTELARMAPPSDATPSMRERWGWVQAARLARKLGRATVIDAVRWTTMPVRDVLDEWLENDLLKAALAARAVFGRFAGPRSPGTGGAWLQRLGDDPSPVGSGVTLRGGPGALAAALEQLIAGAGGRVRTGACVSRVSTKDGTAIGVVLDDGEEIGARTVVSAVDPRQTLLGLVDPGDLAPTFVERMRRFRARGVIAKINLALADVPEFPALSGDPVALRGRLLIAPGLDYLERAFDCAKYGELSASPWLEIAIPSMLDSSLAPPGRHVMSMYVQYAPSTLRRAPWTAERDALFAAAMRVLESHAPGIQEHIIAREVITPDDLERDWGLTCGDIFHGEPSLAQSWAARPLLGWSRYETPIPRLFLASAGTHPGGGITGGSAFLAAQAVAKFFKGLKE